MVRRLQGDQRLRQRGGFGGRSLPPWLVSRQQLRRPWLEPAVGRHQRRGLVATRPACRSGQGGGARLLRLRAARGLGVRPRQLRQLDGFLPEACPARAQERSAAAGAPDGAGDQPPRPGADDLDQLLSALSAGSPDRHARPDVEGQGGLQLRDLDGRAGGAEFRPRCASRARPALRDGRRVRRGRPAALVVVGRRRHRHGQRARHVRRSCQGAEDRLQGPLLRLARTAQHRPAAAGPSRAGAGRQLAAGPGFRRQAHGCGAVRRQHRRGDEGLPRFDAQESRRGRTRSR